MPATIKPTIHLNGTSRESLAADYTTAYEAVSTALDAVLAAGQNARDYYVQGGHATERAMREHQARLDTLASVKSDLLDLLMHITDAG